MSQRRSSLSLGLVKKSLRGTLGALARNKKLRADSTDSKAALNSLSLPPPSSLHLSFTIYFNSFFRRCSSALSFPRRFFSPPPPFPRTFLISYSRALYMCVYTHNYIYTSGGVFSSELISSALLLFFPLFCRATHHHPRTRLSRASLFRFLVLSRAARTRHCPSAAASSSSSSAKPRVIGSG